MMKTYSHIRRQRSTKQRLRRSRRSRPGTIATRRSANWLCAASIGSRCSNASTILSTFWKVWR